MKTVTDYVRLGEVFQLLKSSRMRPWFWHLNVSLFLVGTT